MTVVDEDRPLLELVYVFLPDDWTGLPETDVDEVRPRFVIWELEVPL